MDETSYRGKSPAQGIVLDIFIQGSKIPNNFYPSKQLKFSDKF